MVRTRSQTKSEKKSLVSELVFAHKGKTVPFWFPGKVLRKEAKGYEIEFLTQFGTQVCSEKNVMFYDSYFLQKNNSSALFKVPAKYKSKFQEALGVAEKLSKERSQVDHVRA